MSLILHMKVPGAFVIASDCRVTDKEPLYVTVEKEKVDLEGNKIKRIGKPEDIKPHEFIEGLTNQVRFGEHEYVVTDTEQKTFVLKAEKGYFAVSYYGSGNIKGYPASYIIKQGLKEMTDVNSTYDLAGRFRTYWEKAEVDNIPSLLISGYNDDKMSILEVHPNGDITKHFTGDDSFGIVYNGETSVAKLLVELGGYHYSLFRLQEAMEFCKTLILTTAKILSLQRKQQTVSEAYDMLIMNKTKAEWLKRSSIDFD